MKFRKKTINQPIEYEKYKLGMDNGSTIGIPQALWNHNGLNNIVIQPWLNSENAQRVHNNPLCGWVALMCTIYNSKHAHNARCMSIVFSNGVTACWQRVRLVASYCEGMMSERRLTIGTQHPPWLICPLVMNLNSTVFTMVVVHHRMVVMKPDCGEKFLYNVVFYCKSIKIIRQTFLSFFMPFIHSKLWFKRI